MLLSLLDKLVIIMLRVDKNKCAGCGMCAGLCPDNFQLGLDEKAEVVSEEINDCVRQAQAHCPAQAIEID